MKKLTNVVLIAVVAVTLMGCADNKTICGVEYETYGLLNKDDLKDPNVRYSLSIGNLLWGSFLFGTIAAPIYFFGFSLWEPESSTAACQQ